MKAVVCTKYGSPDVLQLKEVETPVPKDDEVLIKIHAATVNATDPVFRKGEPFIARMFTGLTRPKKSIPGTEFAGEIETVGKDVTQFKKGDQIFAQTGLGYGAHAEYISLPENGPLEIKPTNISYGEAAAVCDGALGALVFLRKLDIQSGKEILINGASGSVGTYAVQLAKYFGAEVTAVCGNTNIELVKTLGADKVIDYSRDDFTRNRRSYDIIFDVVAKSSFARCKASLKQKARYLATAPTLAFIFQVLWTSKIGGKKAVMAAPGLKPTSEKKKDLLFLKELIEAGKLKSVMDRSYPMEQIAEAHRYVETGHKKGNVVLTIAGD